MIWAAAVDMAQLYVALRFLEELRRRQPVIAAVVAVTSEPARRIAEDQARPEDLVVDLPPDEPAPLRQALDAHPPSCLLVVGNALRPGLIREVSRRGHPVAWIGGEFNTGDFATWGRSSEFLSLRHDFALICLRAEAQRDRLLSLGFPAERIHVVGDVKYDSAAPLPGADGRADAILRAAGIREDQPILLGGSVWRGEDAILLDLLQDLRTRHHRLALILAPVLMADVPAMEDEARNRGLHALRRSQLGSEEPDASADILLIDSVGDLRDLYGRADVVFLGRTITHRPGANLAEPAAQGRPIVVGPHMEHFKEILEDFRAEDAVIQVQDAAGLGEAVDRLLSSPEDRALYGRRARTVVKRHAGALGRTVEVVLDVLAGQCSK